LPQLFGISRSEHGSSLYFHAGNVSVIQCMSLRESDHGSFSDDEPEIPVRTYMRGLDPLMRVLFRSKYVCITIPLSDRYNAEIAYRLKLLL
jgi:hypothetical protein